MATKSFSQLFKVAELGQILKILDAHALECIKKFSALNVQELSRLIFSETCERSDQIVLLNLVQFYFVSHEDMSAAPHWSTFYLLFILDFFELCLIVCFLFYLLLIIRD